ALLLYELIQQSVVYKKYRCSHFRSRVRRSPEEDKILEEHGNKILVYELGGNLFFGTTDKLLSEVESEIKEKDMVIIDLKHVRHIDITGAKIIHQITNSIKAVGGEVYISSLKERASDEKINVQQYLKDLDVIQAFDKSQIFDNLNFALEKAEESLLDKQNIRKENNDEITLQISPLFCRLSDNEFQVIKPYFKHLNFSAGQKVFSKGETSNCLYVIVKGKVAIEATGGEKEKTRLSTFTQGSFFGETAVINKNYRETDALAIEKTSLLALESSDLEIIENEQKSIANKILLGLILNLSEHLRVTNESLIKLESV
ncbi:MAG: hypothetical protein CMP11_06150, partial [Zetaproteobacteria bacterium]|nr:hypothetical protein [Pseudobdellovibrionaceae bacterium]